MNTIRQDNLVLHFRTDGPADGRPVLFANSLGTDLRVWDALLPHLRPGLRILRFDKRGHGLSDAPTAPFTIQDLAGDAAAILDQVGASGVTVVGLSIGGLIAQALADKRPDLVRGIVLMDTAARIGTPAMWQDRIAAVHQGGIAGMADAVMARWFPPAFHRDRGDELALWRNMLCRTTTAGYAGCCAAIAGADLTDSTAALRLPAIVMAGELDAATPPSLVQATADLMGAPFHLIPGAGHLPCVDAPELVAAHINRFLEETA